MSRIETRPLAITDVDTEVAVRSIGQWSLIWRRFTRHRLALIGGVVLLAVIALAVIGPFFAPPLIVHQFVQEGNHALPPRLLPWNLSRLMGTTASDFPVSTYVLSGGQVTLVIGFLGAFIASLLGIMIGGVAGYYGRIADAVLMRITDAALTIPMLPLIFLLTFYLPDRNTLTYAILFGLVGWGGIARLVRGYILSLRRREFATAARALGVSDTGIIIRHLLPNALDVVIISFTLNVAVFILTEASLEYVGAPPSGTTWASIMSISYIYNNWWQVVFPAIPLLASVLAINVIGDGLRDAFDTTGSGALLRWRDPSAPPGLLRRLVAPAAIPLRAAGRGTVALWERRPTRRRGWAIPAADEPVFLLRLGQRLERLPMVLRLLPIATVLVIGGVVTLFSHSPLRYAAHFTTPQPVFTAYSSTEYGAHLRGGGGWDVLTAGLGGRLTFSAVGHAGHLTRQQTFSHGSEPALVYGHGHALGVWLDPNSATVQAAYLGTGKVQPFSLVPSTGATDHPVVLSVPGGYDVIFQWQPHPGTGPEYQIYLAFIPTGAHRATTVRRLAASPDYGFYPRAVTDGSGAIDVLWLDRFKINTWAFRFRRFRPNGMPLSARRTVGYMCYPAPCLLTTNVVPSRWNATMARDKDGSVWVAFEGGENGTGTYLNLAHWSRTGKMLLPPTPIPIGFDASPNGGITLALLAHGGQLYYAGANPDGGVGSVTFMQAFDARGSPVGLPQRVNYDASGSSALPHAGTLHGVPHVLWQRVRAGPTYLETSTYHAYKTRPNLLIRLGLNIGSLPLNLVLLVIGGVAGGAAVALADSALVILLLLLWLPIRWVILGPLRPLRWPLFLLVVAVILVAVFGTRPDPPAWVPLIGGLGFLTRWVAVAGAIITAVWTCFVLARRSEHLFRAALTAFAGVYVVAVMYAVIFIQSEITRI